MHIGIILVINTFVRLGFFSIINFSSVVLRGTFNVNFCCCQDWVMVLCMDRSHMIRQIFWARVCHNCWYNRPRPGHGTLGVRISLQDLETCIHKVSKLQFSVLDEQRPSPPRGSSVSLQPFSCYRSGCIVQGGLSFNQPLPESSLHGLNVGVYPKQELGLPESNVSWWLPGKLQLGQEDFYSINPVFMI